MDPFHEYGSYAQQTSPQELLVYNHLIDLRRMKGINPFNICKLAMKNHPSCHGNNWRLPNEKDHTFWSNRTATENRYNMIRISEGNSSVDEISGSDVRNDWVNC